MNRHFQNCFCAVIAIGIAGILAGCSQIGWRDYRGPQAWATGGAFVSDLDGLPLYEGLPERPYEVIGMIEAYDDGDWFRSSANLSRVKKLAQDHDGDALIWLSGRAVSFGVFEQDGEHLGGDRLSAGSDRTAEYLELDLTSKGGFRDCLLLIRWKQ